MTSDPSHMCLCTSNQYLCAGQIEALGDLAHYHKAVAAMVTRYPTPLCFDGTHLGVKQSHHDLRSLTYMLMYFQPTPSCWTDWSPWRSCTLLYGYSCHGHQIPNPTTLWRHSPRCQAISSWPQIPCIHAHVLLTQYLHTGQIEALGDLAHYHKAVAAMVTGSQGPNPEELTTAGISTNLSHTQQCCG